jgi:glycosyltransferase involved in cell wall biosynthesis
VQVRVIFWQSKMATSDYREITHSFGPGEVESLHAGAAGILESCSSLKRCTRRLQIKLRKLIPCVTDDFSSLRYARYFIVETPLVHGFAKLSRPILSSEPGIESAMVDEIESLLYLHGVEPADHILRKDQSEFALFSALAAVTESGSSPDPSHLLSLVGMSPYVDSMVVRVLRTRAGNYGNDMLHSAFRERVFDAGSASTVLLLCMDLASELKLAVLDEDETARLMTAYREDEQVLPALLRYAGENSLQGLSPLILDLLDSEKTAVPILYRCVDASAQLGGSRSKMRLEAIRRRISSVDPLLLEYLDLSIEEISRGTGKPAGDGRTGLTLVQCIFYGDVALPGQAGGGGLTTFLNDLGNTLARREGWEAVYTLVLLPVESGGSTKPLMQQSGPAHYVVRVPVFFPPHDEARRFMVHEYEIKRAIRRTLERHGIDPDIFHVRYSDNASLAVMSLARELGKKAVFTLTPDPHRNFVDREGRIHPMTGENLLLNLNKVFIADELLKRADGLLLIGHDQKNNQVLPYFPQLLLDQTLRTKPLEILAEGVRPSLHFLHGESQDAYLELLRGHEGRYVLDPGSVNRPLILNVGRLNPMKGQHLLVEAWSQSGLSERFNLVLVGGNLNNPDPVESKVIDRIDELMERNEQLRGRFSHLSALPNPKIRLLEQSIMEQVRGGEPNVYVCSSFKEEFGISILEAMAAGFLILAPRNGGVSSYVKHGNNGFLIDTRDCASLRRGMESVLDPGEGSGSRLHEIAEQGKRFVKRTFDIDRIGEGFSRYYEALQ